MPYSLHILLNTFICMRLRYKNYSLKDILFQTLIQQSVYKRLIAKPFDGNTFEIKAASPVQIIKDKRQCFQLFLDRTYILVLITHFLRAQSGVKEIWSPLVQCNIMSYLIRRQSNRYIIAEIIRLTQEKLKLYFILSKYYFVEGKQF